MSRKIASSLHGFAVFFYVLAILGAIGWTIVALIDSEFSYFIIGLGSGLAVVWLGLVLDGLHVIAVNTARPARISESSKNTTENASSTVADELPEL